MDDVDRHEMGKSGDDTDAAAVDDILDHYFTRHMITRLRLHPPLVTTQLCVRAVGLRVTCDRFIHVSSDTSSSYPPAI